MAEERKNTRQRTEHHEGTSIIMARTRDFPGDPVAKTLTPNAWGPGLISHLGTRSYMWKLKVSHVETKT